MIYGLYALAAVAALLVVLALIASSRPNELRVVRKRRMAADAATIFAIVNNLHRWDDWSPWAKLDPAMQKTYEGPDAGVGASYAWKGNNKVGEGKQTIVRSQPHRVIEIDLQFVRPFTSRNRVEFTFEGAGKETEVVWSMVGPQNFMAKLFGLVMNMDKMIGNDFEKGLASLQQLVERPAA